MLCILEDCSYHPSRQEIFDAAYEGSTNPIQAIPPAHTLLQLSAIRKMSAVLQSENKWHEKLSSQGNLHPEQPQSVTRSFPNLSSCI